MIKLSLRNFLHIYVKIQYRESESLSGESKLFFHSTDTFLGLGSGVCSMNNITHRHMLKIQMMQCSNLSSSM